jgi:hypothetical protein
VVQRAVTPFESIESAQEYLVLLSEVVEESQLTIQADLDSEVTTPTRQIEALRLAMYNLERLARHLKSSRRILNDLRMLRRILHQG